MREVHGEDVAAALPDVVLGARDLAMPLKHIDCPIVVLGWLGHKPERMITPPLFPLLLESVNDQFVYLFFLHENII